MNPPSLADVTLTLMEHCSTLELLVFAAVLVSCEARTSKTHSERVALAPFYSLYWVVEAQIYFPTFCILYRRKNGQYLCQNGPSFEYQLVIILIIGKKNYKKINSISTYCE